MSYKKCKWELDDVCTNADCPAFADFCPVAYYQGDGLCRFEEIKEVEE